MQSGFTYTLDDLRRINGNSDHDEGVARKASQEMLNFIENRARTLSEYSNLVSVLDGNSENEIRNLLISIKHVMNALEEISAFHKHGKLNDIFDGARRRAEQIVQSSTEKAKWLTHILSNCQIPLIDAES